MENANSAEYVHLHMGKQNLQHGIITWKKWRKKLLKTVG